MQLEDRLSALLQLHLHSQLNTWLQWIEWRNCKRIQETFKFWDLVRLILEVLRYFVQASMCWYVLTPVNTHACIHIHTTEMNCHHFWQVQILPLKPVKIHCETCTTQCIVTISIPKDSCTWFIWVRSWNCGCLVTWFCYQLIVKPGSKTATVLWADPCSLWWFEDGWFCFPLELCHSHQGNHGIAQVPVNQIRNMYK